ncbi:hypothetical protein Scep_027049 [Stephania cephalantha]|uniref:4-coumarate--CoA ligase n=1 Tax=Stephania cephalantha TaxID=152367 RepID=A0AAP0HTU0_9MAGN
MADTPQQSRHCCISHSFFDAARRNPNKVAVIHAFGGARICKQDFDSEDEFFDRHRISSSHPGFDGDRLFTYSAILESVESLSRRIRRGLDGCGDDGLAIGAILYWIALNTNGCYVYRERSRGESMVGTPHIVGIYMKPSVEYIVAVLSVLRSGEAFLPLDPSWPKERILSIIISARVSLIIKGKSSSSSSDSLLIGTSEWLEAEDHSCPILYMCMEKIQNEHFDASDMVWPCKHGNPRMFCYLMYTSGSTGAPKGVCGTEKGLLNRYRWMQELFPSHGGDIFLFKTSISFVDHLQEFISAILSSTPLVIPPFEELKTNSFYIVDFLQAYCVSRLTIVPSVMRAVLPAIRSRHSMRIKRSLRVLVSSGETLSISLYANIHKLFPETSVLNLYGSTEVSGDCAYFDCKNLPSILDTEVVSSVPIGKPIANCNIVLVEDPNEPGDGEIYVGGLCNSTGYFLDPTATSFKYANFSEDIVKTAPFLDSGHATYFKTGDFARRLHSGDLVFVGRKDRTIKLNGHRVALEEIENVLRENPNVFDAAVVSHKGREEIDYLSAYITMEIMEESCELWSASIRSWLINRLPLAMIPTYYIFVESLSMTHSGKIDYGMLPQSEVISKQVPSSTNNIHHDHTLLQVIKKVFCDALMAKDVKCDDDFFIMGGNSITAAQVAHKLGISMTNIYIFPSPSKLMHAILDGTIPSKYRFGINFDSKAKLKRENESILFRKTSRPRNSDSVTSKGFEVDYANMGANSKGILEKGNSWLSSSDLLFNQSFSRCNKVLCYRDASYNSQEASRTIDFTREMRVSIHEIWKVHLRSCVDASPLVVLKGGNAYLFIGSHAHIFLCVDAISGLLQWEVELEGRVECSAAIVDDFSQVVVGCYKGKIYFLDFASGNILWAFQTQGEVKSQPVADTERHLIWCGSYDHNLYALDYRNHRCVSVIPCGGSIYGSPSIDMESKVLYVASTKGLVTAISIEVLPFRSVWVCELGAPVFGSISVSYPHGNVICCLVDGHVLALNRTGSIIWKASTDGPIFAGACISSALSSQVLVCSRHGSIYSFDLEKGALLWDYNVGDPITAAACVDENMQFTSGSSCSSDRLICICSSSGSVYLLRTNLRAVRGRNTETEDTLNPIVQEFAKFALPGDIFSSPVMIGGRIFVGCRDDYVHCMGVEIELESDDE